MPDESEKLRDVLRRLEEVEARLEEIESGKTAGLQTQRLELLDQDGRVRAWIGFSDEGSPGFWLADEAGQVRVAVELSKNYGNGVRVNDRNGMQRVILNCHEAGGSTASLDLLGPAGFRGPGLSLLGGDDPYMWISDPDTGFGVMASLGRDTGPYVEVFGEDGGAALGAATVKEGDAGEDMKLSSRSLTCFDKACRVLWRKP